MHVLNLYLGSWPHSSATLILRLLRGSDAPHQVLRQFVLLKFDALSLDLNYPLYQHLIRR